MFELLGIVLLGIGALVALAYKVRNARIHSQMNANALANMDDPNRD